MRNLTIILLFLCLTVVTRGQDRQLVIEDFHQEEIDFYAEWWKNPAMRFHFPLQQITDVSLNFSEQNHTALSVQEGSSSNGFLFRANSFFRNTRKLYYGKASYLKTSKEGYKWNTVSDVNLLQPYIIADTVGGKMYSEHYFFSGGYAQHFSNVGLGIFAAYRAATSYKRKDPRPKNTVSDLKLDIAGTWTVSSKYTLGLGLSLNKYQQDQNIIIYKDGGGAALFYLRGLGVADERFSTVITDKSGKANKYKQNIYGLSLTLFPSKQYGFLGAFSGTKGQLDLSKNKGKISLNINSLDIQELKSSFGYKFRFKNLNCLIKSYGRYQVQKGREYIYKRNMTLLSISEKYNKTTYTAGIEALISAKKRKRNYLTRINIFYSNSEEKYMGVRATTSSLKSMQNLKIGLQENLLWNFKSSSFLTKVCLDYHHNLSKNLKTGTLTTTRAKETLVLPDYFFETADYISGKFTIRYDYRITTKYSIYSKAVYEYAKYEDIGKRKFYKFAIGLAF